MYRIAKEAKKTQTEIGDGAGVCVCVKSQRTRFFDRGSARIMLNIDSIPVRSHRSDLFDGNRGVVADAVDGGAHHPVRSLSDHLQVVVAVRDL